MSQILDKLLAVVENQLTDTKGSWVSDIRAEAAHIPAGLARLRFQWSGLMAAIGLVLRVRFGAQKIGQILLAGAICILCLGGFIITASMPDDIVKTTFHMILPIYVLAGVFAVLNLGLLKRYSLGCSALGVLIWFVLGLDVVSFPAAPVAFLRAISLEVSFLMAGLFIAASYLGWIEEGRYA